MRYWMLLLSLLFGVSATAQQRVSFSDALEMMLERNKAISSAQHSVDATYREYRATQGLRMPTADLVGCYTLMQHNVDIDLGGAKGVITESLEGLIKGGVSDGVITPTIASFLTNGLSPLMGTDWRYTLQNRHFGFVGATVTMPIYLGGRIDIANRVAKLNIDGAQIGLNGVTATLVTELVERYYGVILAREVAAVKEFVVRGVEQHLCDAEAMEEQGVVAHSEVLYLQYKLSEVERDYSDAQSKLQIAERGLRTTLQSEDSITPNDNMFVVYDVYNIDYYRDNALNLNSIIGAVENAKQLSVEGVNLARSAFMPEIVAMGGASIYSYNLSDMLPRWAVGVGVSMPLFGGLSKQEQYRASKSVERSISEMSDKVREDILLLVDKEYYTLQNTLLNISSSERSIAFAESYYTMALEGFREGVTPSSELMDARIALAASEVVYLDAVYNYMLSLARLLELSGLSDDFMGYVSRGVIVDINSIIDL
ncbi:MAG: TolC family protein [Alistipes sp.]|nr:TolC family protein [Alistipes sp.]